MFFPSVDPMSTSDAHSEKNAGLEKNHLSQLVFENFFPVRVHVRAGLAAF